MLKCPTCDIPLCRSQVAGAPAHVCPDCQGMFLPMRWLKAIRRNRGPEPTESQVRQLYEQAKFWPAPHLVVLCPKCHELMKAMLVLANGTRPMNVCSKCDACWLEKGDLDLALIHARQIEEGARELTEDQRERVAVAQLHIQESARAESDDSFFGDVDDQEPTMFVLTGARFCVLLPLRILKQMYAFFAASGPDQRRAALGKLIAAVIFAALLAFVVWGGLRR